MYVCICKSVTEGQIHESVACGSRSLADLSKRLGVATNCGQCACAAEEILCETTDAGDIDVFDGLPNPA